MSPSCVGSQEELYCSLVGNGAGLSPAPAPAPAPAPSSSPTVTCAPRPRRNAMVRPHRKLFVLYSVAAAQSSAAVLFLVKKAEVCIHLLLTHYQCTILLQVSGSRPHQKRVKALVDCRAVSSDHLAFFKDEIIVVTSTHDLHWWVSVTTDSWFHNSPLQ